MNEPDAPAAVRAMQVTFEMTSQTCFLPIVRATVGQLALMVGWDESDSRSITMAVDEALANVIRHAYHGRADAPIELQFRAGADQLEIRMRDTGDAPDLARICPSQTDNDGIGGRGTHIIKDVMDAFSYESEPDGNWFTAVKRLRRPA